MANSISLVSKYQPLIDEVYKAASKTIDLESEAVLFDGAQTVKIMKMQLDPLADYSRNGGFVDGDVTVSWEDWKLTQDRGREFSVDNMDNDETLDLTAGKLLSTFVRTQVVPEVDAYRFAKMAQTSGISTATDATLTDATVVAAIDAAIESLANNEVPKEELILYVTPAVYGMMKRTMPYRISNGDKNIDRNFDTLDGIKIVEVPEGRFYTKIDIKTKDGSNNGGFAKATDGKQINFILVARSAVEAVAKHVKLRVFEPNVNQDKDAWKFQYRIYHDEFVYANKVAGIYLSAKAAT